MKRWPHSAFQSPKGHATFLDPFFYFLVHSPSLDALLPRQQHSGQLSATWHSRTFRAPRVERLCNLPCALGLVVGGESCADSAKPSDALVYLLGYRI